MHDAQPILTWALTAGGIFLLCTLTLEFLLISRLKRLLARNPKLKPEELEPTAKLVVTRMVGTLHNAVQIPLAVYILCDKQLRADPLFATNAQSQLLVAIATGYFLHDFLLCAIRFELEGPLYMLHAASCLAVYGYGIFSGYLHYFGAAFMLWELSTPFVHLRWFMYKMAWDKSPWYLCNGLVMMVVFFCCRNLWGLFMSVWFWVDSAVELGPSRTGKLSPAHIWFYRISNWALNGLNAVWFTKMVQKVVAIFLHGKNAAEVSHDKDE